MKQTDASNRLWELVRLRADVERFQRAMQAMALCPEVRSSAYQQLSTLAQQKKIEADRLHAELAACISHSQPALSWSVAEQVDPSENSLSMGVTQPRTG